MTADKTTIGRARRDPRVDFWRGVAMLIIFMAHVPGNAWAKFIPARFGPSDATEMFVFCSGFASAVAFGGTFARHGFGAGAARVALRCWQIYWAHIALFAALVVVCFLGNAAETGTNYLGKLNLLPFINDPARGLFHLLTLTYVPNYFDILPMYMVVLLMLPAVMAIARYAGPSAALGAVAVVWLAAQILELQLPAEWWSERPWFFNPLGWCLIFFTGFAVSMGWLSAPRPKVWLIVLCVVFVLALVPVSHWPTWRASDTLTEIHGAIRDGLGIGLGSEKTNFGLLRYVHFLALAYLAHCFFQNRTHWLEHSWLAPIMTIGRNALPVFLVSMALAWSGGIVLDLVGRSGVHLAAVNLTGFAVLLGVAHLSAYYKTAPWTQARRVLAPPAEAAPR